MTTPDATHLRDSNSGGRREALVGHHSERRIGTSIPADRFPRVQPVDEMSRQPRISGLTVGELDVLTLMSLGHSNSGIARDLFLAQKTIEGRVSNIFAKFGFEESSFANRRVLSVLRFLEAEQSRVLAVDLTHLS